MTRKLLSVRSQNLYGYVALGTCALSLGLAWGLSVNGLTVLIDASLTIALGILSLAVCLSGKGEPFDEMAVAHAGSASSAALTATLTGVGLACLGGLYAHQTFDPGCACCICIGFGLVARGVVFEFLERESADADD